MRDRPTQRAVECPAVKTRRRKLWPFVSGGVVLLAIAAVASAFAFRMRVAQAASGFLEDTMEMVLELRTRPAHASSQTVGSFGKCAEPRLDSYIDLNLNDEPEACKAFRAPNAPRGRIPDECLAIVTPHNALAWARGLMACSRSDSAGLPENIFTAGHQRQQVQFAPWTQAAKILGWEVRAQTATGQFGLAFETCADVIASCRDLSWGGALAGTMAAVTNLRIIYPACVEAVVQADAAQRKKFHGSLEAIWTSMRTNSAMLRDEAVIAGIEVYGFELEPRQQATLPKELRDRIGPAPAMFPKPQLLGWQLMSLRAMNADLRKVADLPDDERAPLIAKLAAKHSGVGSVASLEKFLRRADELPALVELLAAASSVDARSPASSASFTVTSGAGAFEFKPVNPELAKYAIKISLAKK